MSVLAFEGETRYAGCLSIWANEYHTIWTLSRRMSSHCAVLCHCLGTYPKQMD